MILGVYFTDSFLISFPDYLQMTLLVFAVHLVVNNKFAGHAAAIGIWLVILILRNFADYNFNLFFFSYKPGYTWSDMNGLGHFGKPLFWFNLYWTAWGIFLVLFFSVFFSRGSESSWRSRWKMAKDRFFGTSQKIALFFLAVALGSGAYIYQNVVYKKNYLTPDENDIRQVAYEQQLKKYEGIPQPKYTKVNIQADLYPMERDAYFTAEVELVNKTDSPIDSIHFNSSALSDFKVVLDGDTLKHRFPLKLQGPEISNFREESEARMV